jgi:tRNA/rRNA methyltransferase
VNNLIFKMQVSIVIVEPQIPENIGAIARCMKNFALCDLRVVKPRFNWPDEKCFAISAGADDVLNNAKVYNDFHCAVEDLSYLYACSARKRYMNKEYILSKSLSADVCANQQVGHRVGILFGREANGLSNAEVNICNKILVIDNNQSFQSLNIAQAVCVIAYELFGIGNRQDLANTQDLCNKQELDSFFQDLASGLDNAGFFKVAEKREHMLQNIKNIYSRIDKLSKSEVNTLRGILVALKRS